MRILFALRAASLDARHYTGALLKGLSGRGHGCYLMTRRGPALPYLAGLAERRWGLPWVHRWARHVAGRIIRTQRIEAAVVRLCGETVPVVAACHDAGIPVVALVLSRQPLCRWQPVLALARGLVVLNRGAYDWHEQACPALAPNLRLSHKMIDRALFHPDGRPAQDGYRVACISRLSHTKGEVALQVVEAVHAVRQEIPGLTLTVAGYGALRGKVRACARALNRQAGDEVVRVLGGISRPEELMRQSDLVVGTGFTAAEALACHCQVIGLGVRGLQGLVTPGNIHDALAVNFGDMAARWPEATPELIAGQIREAYLHRDDSRAWAEAVIARRLNTDHALQELEQMLIAGADAGEGNA